MRARLSTLVLALSCLLRPAAATPPALLDFVGDAAKQDRLPVEFLVKAITSLGLKVEFSAKLVDSCAQFNRKDTIILSNALSADGQGNGGMKAYSLVSEGDRATIFHELMHAYVAWAEGSLSASVPHPEARTISAYFGSALCRYENVILQETGQTESLSASQKHDLLNEFWAVWFAALMRYNLQVRGWVRSGAIKPEAVPAMVQEWIRQSVMKGGTAAYYYNMFGKQMHVKEPTFFFNDAFVLMRDVLKMDEALDSPGFTAEVFKNFGRPFEKDRPSCILASVVVVLDASGSMGSNIIGSAKTRLDTAKETIAAAVNQLPDDHTTEIALIVFRDCDDIRVVLDFTTDRPSVINALVSVSPGQDTPIAASMEKARQYMKQHARGRQARFMLMTDGQETCNGRPSDAARSIGGLGSSLRGGQP